MSGLRAILSHLRPGERGDPRPFRGRRSGRERRQGQRRSNVYPLQDKDTRLRFAARAAGFGIYDLDCETGDMFWSQELRVIAGLPPDDSPLSREEVVRLVHPDDRRRFVDAIDASLDPWRTASLELEFRLLQPDGNVRGVKMTGSTFFVGEAEGRHPLMATGVVMDITERQKAEEALRRSQRHLELAVHGAAMGTWNLDLRSGVLECSERCRELFGIAPDESVSYERVLAALHPDDRERTVAAKAQAVERHKEYNIEHRFVWSDGSVHWLASVGRGVYDDQTEAPIGMSGVVQDISERKKGEEELLHMNEQLESRIAERTAALVAANEALVRSNLDLQQFAYVAAHDLQTPLRSVIGFAQLFHKEYRGRLDSQADTWLDQLLRSAQRMFDLIQDLLSFARVDSLGGAFRPTDMRGLFDEVLSALDANIRESGARVTCGDLPAVMGDRMQLLQLLQNLIGNAIKYHGETPPEVHVSASRQDDEWLFAVRDNGIGIAEKHRERIFEIFYRLHTQQEYPGTGIGLAVCRRVVHRHGGRIGVDSEPGRGSTFWFTLPDRSKVAA